MPRIATVMLMTVLVLASGIVPSAAASRVKDLANVEGVRQNQLIGYGLVVGLNSTGDSLRNAPFTQLSIQTMLERLGVNTRGASLQTKDVAGQAHIKTGTLNNVRAIGGYVLAASGRRYVVVCLVNSPAAGGAQGLQDALLQWVYGEG